MKVAFYRKSAYIVSLALLCWSLQSAANGCTGSWFTMQYSPWCGCWQVCGNYISDCDEIVSLNWNFGDGTTATGESPCHQYAQPGTYTVTMTVVAYCHNSFFNLFTTTCPITQQITVTNNVPTLQAAFTADTPCLGEPTQFTATPISPSGTNAYTWVWPDGTTSTGANPTHTFDSCGAYDVMMIVTNTTPCCATTGTDTVIQRVYVNCNPFDESNTLGTTDPYIQESSANIQVTSGTCPGDTTHFLVTPNGPITNWVFYFPDSTYSLSPNPTYVYTNCPPAVDYTYVYLFTNRGCFGIIDSITGIFCPSNINLTSTQTLCSGQCSGTATATIGGGTPPYTLTWSDPNNQTTGTATNLCAGNYTVTVTDGNGCSVTPPPVMVNDFPTPFAGIVTSVGGPPCYGWIGGSAVLDLSGGTVPYDIFWSNGSTTATLEYVSGGVYYVTATDGHGCIYQDSAVIPEPPPIGATFTVVNTGCGLCNGTATANATGGHGTYNYYWQTTPQQTSATATGLCAGIYHVIIEDTTVGGCQDTFTVTVNENGAQPITTSSTDATCPNICNGTATVMYTGGCLDPPCTAVWLDSSGTPIGQAATTATGLCEGTYIVHVTNASGCNAYANVVVGIPNPMLTQATATVNTCGSSCNGSVTATVSGGTAPYAYQWTDSGGAVISGQTNATATGLCPGSYTAQIIDQQGCIATATATVFSNALTASATANSVRCNGDCNGIITAIASGGSLPYSYTLQNAGGSTIYSGSSNIIANLCAGSYTLAVNDAGNCSITIPLTISEPSSINPVLSPSDATCYGKCDGAASVQVSGGTPPYTYEWRNSAGQLIAGGTAPDVYNLCSGNYVVQIKDSNNCAIPFVPVNIGQPSEITDSLKVIDPYCDGGLGTLDLTPYGGTPPYTYNWNNGTYTTQDITGLTSGTYVVGIIDSNGCWIVDSATFTLLPLMTVSITAHSYNGYHFKCYNGHDGEVVVHVMGGLPPYTYQWNDSLNSTVDSIYGLGPGLYTVTVTDANGCERIDSIALNLIPPPFSLTEVHQDVACYGDSSGNITITPVGGVPPYIGYWAQDTSLFTLQLTQLDTGQYTVYVFDSVFCLRVDTIYISQPGPLQISHSSTDALCFGVNNGSVDLTVTGGTSPYVFDWNNGTYTTEDLSSLGAGTYVVLVTDSNQCTISDSATIAQPAAMNTQVTHTNVSCFAGNDGTVQLNVTGGNPPYSYSWNNGQYTTQNLNQLTMGTYTVVVTDNQNCTAQDSAALTEPPLITGSRPVSICDKDSFFTQGAYQHTAGTYYDTLTAANGCDSVLATQLSLVNTFATAFDQTICFGQGFYYHGQYYTAAGSYTDTLTSVAGCDSVVTFHLNILPDIELTATPDHAKLVLGDTVTIHLLTSHPGEIISYSWSPQGGLSCNNCPVTTASPETDTRYVAIAVDSNGCRDTVLIPVLVNGPVIFIPNVFTPNGDGANDLFEIYGDLNAIRFLDIKIFDRWGEKVFESNNHHFGWNGMYKGQSLSPGVYVYILNVSFNNQIPEKLYKGSVTLLR